MMNFVFISCHMQITEGMITYSIEILTVKWNNCARKVNAKFWGKRSENFSDLKENMYWR
jgi:hypothetical protein